MGNRDQSWKSAPRRATGASEGVPALPPGLAGSILDFLDAMRVEAGLARNTIAAYRTDLEGLGHWLGQRGVIDWSDLDEDRIISSGEPHVPASVVRGVSSQLHSWEIE